MTAPARIVKIGETFGATLALSRDSVKSFATLVNDLNPLHHDDAYAAQSRFGGLIASGTQPTAHFMAMIATHFSQNTQPLGLEFDMKLKRAAHAHDVLTFEWRVVDAYWKSSLNGDLVKLEGTAKNQHGDTLIVGRSTILVMPKPAAEAAKDSTS